MTFEELRNEYIRLNAAFINSDQPEERKILREQLNVLSLKIKAAEKEIGWFSRPTGNYDIPISNDEQLRLDCLRIALELDKNTRNTTELTIKANHFFKYIKTGKT